MSEHNQSQSSDRSGDILAGLGVVVLLLAAYGFWLLGQ